MKRFIFFLTLVLLLGFLPAQSQLVYKVEGNGLAAPSYIFGTHHLAPVSIADSLGVMQVMDEVRQVVGEIDMTGNPMELGMTMQSHIIAPADSTLSKLLPDAEYALAGEMLKKYAPVPGMDIAMFDALKPMVVTALITVGLAKEAMPGFDAAQQLDTWMQTQAKQRGKIVKGLETADFQASVLYDSTSLADQAETLIEMVRDPQSAIELTGRLTDAYKKGDLERMMKLSQDDNAGSEPFSEALLLNRNRDWLTKLPALMQTPSLIVVGALHLPGPDGILDGLRKLGYTVTPVK